MKRILVVDESDVIRETLALILGREFAVVQRPLGREGFSYTDADRDVNLLIIGLSPEMGVESSTLLTFASQVPFAVLFLLDSKTGIPTIEDHWAVDCLAKPFNPYELKEKVARLLSRRRGPVGPFDIFPSTKTVTESVRYLEFPFLSRSAALLARRFAETSLPIHIYGEIGCGQEEVARATHALSSKGYPWISFHASEVNEEVMGRRVVQEFRGGSMRTRRLTLYIDGVETLSIQAQSFLLQFLQSEEEKSEKFWVLTTSRADLLEKVYRGEFLEPLYHKLAVLILRLAPLRERQDDLPLLAAWFADRYAGRLDLGKVSVSLQAVERLRKYLWFGNMHELEVVIARTLATHRKGIIEASDWIFGVPAGEPTSLPQHPRGAPTKEEHGAEKISVGLSREREETRGVVASSNGRALDLKILIHELAHELKNPMVTIKTFAQLLGERYQDETFRARFQDIVGHDIERMDDLLEVMIKFADFSQPSLNRILLQKELGSVLEEIASKCAEREAKIHWKGEQNSREILADEAQLKYALKNIFLAVLSQMKLKTEIEIDMEKEGCISISYIREGGRITPLSHYLNLASDKGREAILPLRILLAKHLVERNGGEVVMGSSEGERELLRMEFAVA